MINEHIYFYDISREQNNTIIDYLKWKDRGNYGDYHDYCFRNNKNIDIVIERKIEQNKHLINNI